MQTIAEAAHWQISKPAVTGKRFMVATQHHLATQAGIDVLRSGGNAIDAAIAAGLMLGVVEPWMSGYGGGGYLLTYQASEDRVYQIDFGMQAPGAASPDHYPLAEQGTNSSDAFNWPAVQGDRNIHGPLAIAVPAYFKGIELAHQRFASMPRRALAEAAIRQAKLGLPIDWYSAMKINQSARALRQYPSAAGLYLEDGLPPTPNLEGGAQHHPLPHLANTLDAYASAGPAPFFEGDLAAWLTEDLKNQGAILTRKDLETIEATLTEPVVSRYRDQQIFAAGALTAGPSLIDALAALESNFSPDVGCFGAEHIKALVSALKQSYAHRLQHMGAGDTQGATTHVCIADEDGNIVSMTQTIMSAFGARVASNRLGIVLNNGMMWFDPSPGRPNSVAPGRKPLCNMCPTLMRGDDGAWAALGACGGRKIFPSVFQLISYLTDGKLSVDAAAHAPRVDVSGSDTLTVMQHMPEEITSMLKASFDDVRVRANDVAPAFFALPQLLRRHSSGQLEGACFIPSPHAKVLAD